MTRNPEKQNIKDILKDVITGKMSDFIRRKIAKDRVLWPLRYNALSTNCHKRLCLHAQMEGGDKTLGSVDHSTDRQLDRV